MIIFLNVHIDLLVVLHMVQAGVSEMSGCNRTINIIVFTNEDLQPIGSPNYLLPDNQKSIRPLRYESVYLPL